MGREEGGFPRFLTVPKLVVPCGVLCSTLVVDCTSDSRSTWCSARNLSHHPAPTPLLRIGVCMAQCRGALCKVGVKSPIAPPGSGSQSWLFCPLISLALAAERARGVRLHSTGSRSSVPDVRRDLGCSQATEVGFTTEASWPCLHKGTEVIQLSSNYVQSLHPDSGVARASQSECGGGQHLPATVLLHRSC